MRKLALLPLFLLILGISDTDAKTFLNRKVSSRARIIRSLTLLPPTAYKPRKFDSTDLRQIIIRNPLSTRIQEREEERVEALEIRIGDFVSSVLRKSGWQVNDREFSPEVLQNNPKMSILVDSLRASYEVLVRQMDNRPKDTKKGRYSLGKNVADLNLPSSADIAVLVYGKQTIYGRGENKWIDLHLSFADAQTGEILCYFHTNGPLKEEQLLKEFKRIPR